MRVVDIMWDTDGELIDDLPGEVSIDGEIEEDAISDYLSDVYGWCVSSFRIAG